MPMLTVVLIISTFIHFQDFKYTISNGAIAGVEIGSTKELFISKLSDQGFSYSLDSIESCIACDEFDSVYYFHERGQTLFRADLGWTEKDKGRISRVIVYSSKFETYEGISVGKTIGDLEGVYRDLEFYMDGHTGIHLFTDDFSGSFGIEVPNVDRWFELTLDSLETTQKINEIILVE